MAAETRGARWRADAWDVPGPSTADIHRAQVSEAARREVDLAYAAWLGLPDDEVGPFIDGLADFDRRTRLYFELAEAEEYRARVTGAILRADLDAFWHEHGAREVSVAAPRIDVPRIRAPRIFVPRAA